MSHLVGNVNVLFVLFQLVCCDALNATLLKWSLFFPTWKCFHKGSAETEEGGKLFLSWWLCELIAFSLRSETVSSTVLNNLSSSNVNIVLLITPLFSVSSWFWLQERGNELVGDMISCQPHPELTKSLFCFVSRGKQLCNICCNERLLLLLYLVSCILQSKYTGKTFHVYSPVLDLSQMQYGTPNGYCFMLLRCPLPSTSLHWPDTNHTLITSSHYWTVALISTHWQFQEIADKSSQIRGKSMFAQHLIVRHKLFKGRSCTLHMPEKYQPG